MGENEKKISEEIFSLKKIIQKLKEENDYLKFNSNNFQEFLAKTYITPKLLAPFSKEDKEAFLFMDHIVDYLCYLVSINDYYPLVSVIMPTFNRSSIIKTAIDSILNQTYTNFELIIIDDGSEDHTIELLKSIDDKRIKILSNKKNSGCAYSRNQGLKIAKGEIIMYLDSDNTWDSRYIETVIGAYIELPNADALYTGQYLFKGFEAKNPYAIRFCPFNKPLLHNHNFIDMNCFSHKKETYNKIGGFNESLWKLEDWELIIRISNKLNVYAIPVLLSNYFEHIFEDRLTNIKFNYYDACDKILTANRIPIKEYENLNKKVSIIIPCIESSSEIKDCINSILSCNFNKNVDIIVVENNSDAETLEYLFKAENEKNIKLIFTDDENISSAIKKAIGEADINSDLLFLKKDSVLTEGTLEEMQDCAYSKRDAGLIVPHEMTTKGEITTLHVPYAHPHFECDTLPSVLYQNITNLPTFHNGGLIELDYVPFFCTYIKREVYNKTLCLNLESEKDEDANHIFLDFIKYILKLKIYQAPNAFVYHNHNIRPDKSKYNEKMLEILNKGKKEENNLSPNLNNGKPIWDF